ncbi:universal stress protein [Streptomyces zingiberis]|uniref:Universal stress protein n=1 Tax=Streptomyces zingiberis TaxID=2053010 RepID=A0ABX1BV43_9ACTN|nr:universal stress protein [Streptomyces zingiberis]NJQ00410.1 universal stress protein [Streptomyces zingiberis]
MLESVVAGVDGSPQSVAAAGWAAREAVRRSRPLRLVCAEEGATGETGTTARPEARPSWTRQRLAEAEEGIRHRHPDLPVDIRHEPGPAVDGLLAQEAELLVLGSRGLSGAVGHLLGSVSLAVAGRATRPVVLVRADHDPRAPEHGTVVVGFDRRHPAGEPAEFALETATARGARVRALHAWDVRQAYGHAAAPPGPEILAEYEEPARRYLAATVAPWRAKYPGVEITETPARGNASQCLIDAGAGADLLVVGHRLGDRDRAAPLGHVTHAVLHHAPCPVAVVPAC